MDGAIINCMGMAMENILSRPTSAISRNSDDFMPNKENGAESDAEAHLDTEQLQEMTVAQLKELAAELGIETAKLRKKDDLIAAIVDVPVEPGEEIGEGDLPDLSAAAPVV